MEDDPYYDEDFQHVFCMFFFFLFRNFYFITQAYSVDGNPLKLEDEFRNLRHSAVLAAAKASLVPATPRCDDGMSVAEPTPRRTDGQPVTHRLGRMWPDDPKSWGIPNSINGWMVYFMENPIKYRWELGVPPILWNFQVEKRFDMQLWSLVGWQNCDLMWYINEIWWWCLISSRNIHVFMIMYSNYYVHDNPVVIHYNLASSCKLSIIIL